jgi:hypothetical protein
MERDAETRSRMGSGTRSKKLLLIFPLILRFFLDIDVA